MENKINILNEKKIPSISFIFAAYNFTDNIKSTIDSLLINFRELGNVGFQLIIVCVKDYKLFGDLYINDAEIYADPGGISAAWNLGLKKATGKYINFIGDGDYPSKQAIQQVLIESNLKDCNSVVNCRGIFFKAGSVSRRLAPNKKIRVNLLGVNVHTPCLFIPREKLINFEFPEEYRIAMDVFMVLHLAEIGTQIVPVDSNVLIEENGISVSRRNEAISEYIRIISRAKNFHPALGSFIIQIYKPYRKIKELINITLRDFARSCKHFLIFGLNVISNLMPGGYLRKIFLKTIGIEIGRGASIRSMFRLYGFGNIIIGENSVVNRGCILDNRGLITIASNVSVAHEVKIYTAGHNLKSPFFEQVTKTVTIDDYAAIFPGAIINPGVHLRRGCVVLGGSVVYGTHEENSIIAGNPAKKIGERNGNYRYSCKYDVRFGQ